MAARVRIKDVASLAGVSVGTVSNVINNPDAVSDEYRERVREAIERLGYVRSEPARQLRTGSGRIVAMLVLDVANPFFAEVARGAEQVLRGAGLGVMVCNSAGSRSEESEYLSLVAEQGVRGVLLTPADGRGRAVDALQGHGIPFVLVDRSMPRDEGCSVSVDNAHGGAEVARHLLSAGHERIAYVGGPTALPQVLDRFSGARSAVRHAGLPDDALLAVDSYGLNVAAGRDAGARIVGLPSRPTAVFCANDLLALGVLQALSVAGVRVPDEIAVVGYDDIEFAAAAAVPLSSVRQPAFEIGRTAAELLLSEAREDAPSGHRHREVVLRPELVVRESSRSLCRGEPESARRGAGAAARPAAAPPQRATSPESC
ncbi:LacI family DNA-binding transcriptional regulator [Yinghuangia sp. YIM S09857]|uniref:LacI family DNA-binding transcriptional regulator n=1 Tax=Yinghuangia sp. YIM S09857 TaxID=3436929 RepID=UPI003F529A7D